ncbi:MAG: pyruvate dehydrogenase (acetyl-transferring), homodimeric type [Planctomycetes bacterium]|nr:pyruvate dehydrogenase (acetyl-transferring), homodimeric type [Planctomycetota bacterium]
MRTPMIEDPDPVETREWAESLDGVIDVHGRGRATWLVGRLMEHAAKSGVDLPSPMNTPYLNTIPHEAEPDYPGDRDLERRLKRLIRWNAMALVHSANQRTPGIGGHISTFQSTSTLFEIGLNWFFRGRTADQIGDQVFFQGHASPGLYARAWLEGRLSDTQMKNFRRELEPGGGLSSYPHPWLMPDFWQFPTVSMGLSPLCSIYQARFNRYLLHRGMADTSQSRVWAFLGDGEMDEPESLGAITLASREKLDNLTWIVNCNLQRLDGPVRGNGKIIQELEAAFRGAGWNVIKVVWGSDWDPLLDADATGTLVKRMGETVDGQYQKYVVEDGEYAREKFFGPEPELKQLVAHLSKEQIHRLNRGGHDPVKVYAAFKAATETRDRPTVILAKTVKGYGLGDAGEGRNTTHNQKHLDEAQLKKFLDRLELEIPNRGEGEAPFWKPDGKSPEIEYLKERRAALGGSLPRRVVVSKPLDVPSLDFFKDFLVGGGEKAISTTMAHVRMMAAMLKHPGIGKRLVPIVPDEARTFGMESLFRQCAIYASQGQLYEPVDKEQYLYYREAKEGQILEEGINEAGSLASFIAAGTSYATHGEPMIPMFTFYSMFGMQRVGDLIWQAADQRARGFLFGATAGRTTLNGEGLQHEDGNSHLLALPVPNLVCYDATYAYELAVIVQDGIKRMYGDGEDVLYYVTIYNENYEMPAMPEGSREGILRGCYRLRKAAGNAKKKRVHLMGAGTILREVLRGADLLRDKFGIDADVWSVTSWKELRRDALDCERWNMLHPDQPMRVPYLTQLFKDEPWPVVAASDFVKAMPHLIAPWVPQGLHALGTDGFGRSETRQSLRRFFEVDGEHVAIAALWQLAKEGEMKPADVAKAIRELGIDPDTASPTTR